MSSLHAVRPTPRATAGRQAALERAARHYDGDEKTDVAVFRDGVWYIKQSSNAAGMYINFGLPADVLVPADYDGDGRTDVAVYRNGTWYLDQTTAGFTAFEFGLPTDTPVPARQN